MADRDWKPYPDAEHVRNYALRYREAGLACIPITPGSKEPDYFKLRETGHISAFSFGSLHRFNRALPSVEHINKWFATPACIGLVAGPNDIIVIDFDKPEEFERWRIERPDIVNHTPVQATGRGFHVLMRMRRRSLDSRAIMNGIHIGDYRARGWVVAAPSVHCKRGTMYRWLDGQAPWEMPLQEIDSLESIGLEQFDVENWHRPLRLVATVVRRQRWDRVQKRARSGKFMMLHRYFKNGTR